MGIFKSKGGTGGSPIDQVTAMRQQGYSNNQIISTLQRDGYNSSQIFDAMSQSDMSMAPTNDLNAQTQQLGQQLPPMGQQSMSQMPPMSMSQSQMSSQMPAMQQQIPMSGLQSSPEELVEAIIDEKWNELVKDINKVIDWKQKADNKIAAMEQKLADMQEQFDKLHQGVLGKVNDYDKHILEVGSQLQAMEKVFGKVLPTFIDNVNELSAITQRVKASSSEKSSEKRKKAKVEDDERM